MIKMRTYLLGVMALLLSATSIVRSEEPKFPALESDPKYMELRERNEELLRSEDSIHRLITQARAEFSNMRDTIKDINDAMDKFSSYIIDLEQSIFELRQQRGDVITEINDIEQRYILDQMYNEQINAEKHGVTAETEQPAEGIEGESTELVNELLPPKDGAEPEVVIEESKAEAVEEVTTPERALYVEYLTDDDIVELQIAEAEDEAMEGLANAYINTYMALKSVAEKYMAATTEAEANKLLETYNALRIEADDMDREINRCWNHIIDTKYYAYGCILEHKQSYRLLDKSSSEFRDMRQKCNENDGYYASDALMHYAIGRTTLLEFEIAFFKEMELSDIVEALEAKLKALKLPNYRLKPISIEERLFLNYEDITFGELNFYNNSNPLPALVVYERGTIYRIFLGSHDERRAVKEFKGIQPLYIVEAEDGSVSYYSGGFATRSEADEAQLMLLERDFETADVCRWRDGAMVNLTKQAMADSSTEVAPTGSRYMVVLKCESLSDSLRTTLSTIAPDKMISRTAEGFMVGTFPSSEDAEELIATLAEHHPEVETAIKELDL